MLYITIHKSESWDPNKEEFVYSNDATLSLEHSLVSISKWEAKWKKPFLTNESKTSEEIIDYIKCMTITQNVSDDTYTKLSSKNISEITAYIENSMTATWFNDEKNRRKYSIGQSEQITSELIYYWMVVYQIPFECQKWHINRLLTLIKICSVKNDKPKQLSRAEILARNKELNAQRRARLNSKG